MGATLAVAAVGVAIVASSGRPVAQDQDQVFAAREALMQANRDATRSIAPMFRGEADYDAQTVREAGATYQAHGGEALSSLFPEGSLSEDSRALPAIWEDWERFSALADDLAHFGAGLEAAAENAPGSAEAAGSGFASAAEPDTSDPEVLAGMPADEVFRLVGGTCQSCHSDFRAEN